MANRKLIVELIGDPSSLEHAFRRAGDSANGFGSALGKAAKTAALASVALGGLAAVGIKKSLDAYSNLNEQINKNKVVFRSNGDEVVKWSKGLAQNFGLSSRAALESAGTFGNMLVPMGFAREKAAKMSESLVQLAGDMSSFNNASPADTLEAIRSGLAGETEPLRKYGVFLNQARVQHELLTEGIKGSWNAVSQASKAQAIYNIIQKDTVDAHGDFARTSTGMANAQRVFSAELENTSAQLGQAFYPAAVKVLGIVNATIPRIAAMMPAIKEGIGNAWNNYGKPAFEAMLAGGKLIVDWTRANWPQISAHISSAMQTIRSIITQVTSAAKAIWEQFGSAIVSIAQKFLSLMLGNLRNAFEILKAEFRLVGDLIHGRWGKVWDDIKTIVSNSLQIVVRTVETFVSIMYTAALAVGKSIVGGIMDGLKDLKDKVSGALHYSLWDAVKAAGNSLHGSGPFQFTNEAIGVPLGQGVLDGWTTSTQSLGAIMAGQIKKAIDATKAIIAASQSDFAKSFQGFTQIADQMFGGIAATVQTKAGKALAALTGKHDAAALAKGIADARTQLADAQAANAASLTTAQSSFDAAQKALDDARAAGADASEIQQRQFDLGTARADLKTAYSPDNDAAVLAAQQALADALYQQKVANLTREAAEEQRDLTARNQVKQIAFDGALTKLQDHLAKNHASTKVAMEAITKLLRSYGITFSEVGAAMGQAWVQGLRDAIMAAAKGSGSLKKVIEGQALTLGGALGGVPQAASGGYVAATGLAVIHQGETVVPAGRGSMGTTELHFHIGTVIGNTFERAAEQLADPLLIALRRRTNNGGLGLPTP